MVHLPQKSLSSPNLHSHGQPTSPTTTKCQANLGCSSPRESLALPPNLADNGSNSPKSPKKATFETAKSFAKQASFGGSDGKKRPMSAPLAKMDKVALPKLTTDELLMRRTLFEPKSEPATLSLTSAAALESVPGERDKKKRASQSNIYLISDLHEAELACAMNARNPKGKGRRNSFAFRGPTSEDNLMRRRSFALPEASSKVLRETLPNLERRSSC